MTVIITRLRLGACVLAVLVLAGCSATSTPATSTAATSTAATGPATARTSVSATGLITGRLVMEGGPLGPGGQQPTARPIAGTVTFTAAGHRPVSAQVGSSGTFSVMLAPGRYQVSGSSTDIETVSSSGGQQEQACSQPLSATVTAGQTITITVVCAVP